MTGPASGGPASCAHAGSRWHVVALCVLVALIEGFDLQAAGVAAPGLGRAFDLAPSQLGLIFAAGTSGLLPGAFGGGWLADRFGRKRVLIGSVIVFGLFSLATTAATNFTILLFVRFMTGVGLGAAMPNLIALSVEAVIPSRRNLAVAAMYGGMPLGGIVAAVIGLGLAQSAAWQVVFHVGGLAPLFIAPLLWFCLDESSELRARHGGPAEARESALGTILFGEGRATTTLCLWTAYFFTLIVLYLLQNWLPMLMLQKGLTRGDTALTQILFNVGGVAGVLAIGFILDRGPRKLIVLCVYAGLLLALYALARLSTPVGVAVAACAGGALSIGAQFILYSLAPAFYHLRIRGTGVGAAVAVGRIGSFVGPLAAGYVLGNGGSAETVLFAVVPGVIISAAAVELLLIRRRSEW